MRRPTVKMGAVVIGGLLAVASVDLPAAHGAMWRTGGTYYSWQAGRNINGSWGMSRGGASLWNRGSLTAAPAAGSVTINQPVTTYRYVVKHGRPMTAVSTYTPVQGGTVMSVSTGYLQGIQNLGGTTAYTSFGSTYDSCSVIGTNVIFANTTQLTGSGLLTLTNDDRIALNTFNGGSSGSLIVASVPEPTSVGLLLCGVGGLLRRRRR